MGSPETSRRARTLVAVVLVLLVLGLAGDRWQSERELDRLLAAVADGEQVIHASQASLTGLADYQSDLLHSPDTPQAARAAAYDNLASDARRWHPRVAARQEQVTSLQMAPWHQDLREAREAYAVRVQRWTEVLERYAGQPQTGGDPRGEVADARDAARAALLVAAGGERERVTRLLGGREGGPGRRR